jgi:hypothetical protein
VTGTTGEDKYSSTPAGDISEVWRLCEYYTIAQAAMLIAGHDASHAGRVEQLEPSERPPNYEAAKHALLESLRHRQLGHIEELHRTVTYTTRHGDTRRRTERFIDVEKSTVSARELRSWLSNMGVTTGFFFQEKKSDVPDYLNPKHHRYAPKLAAAVLAWQALEDSGTPARTSAKSTLTEWLTENAVRFGLVHKDGSPNNTGIGQIASVANWQPEGGAPKTPSKS